MVLTHPRNEFKVALTVAISKSTQDHKLMIKNTKLAKHFYRNCCYAPKPRALVIGASGMAGQAFMKQLKVNGCETIGLSRTGPDIKMDATVNKKIFREKISSLKPDLIVNCAAIVSLEQCESKPKEAENVNSHLPGELAEYCSDTGAKFIQISTDHFYRNDKCLAHAELDPIVILNKYAETKRLGEIKTLSNKEALIIRTNITGVRGIKSRPTFAEWLFLSIKGRRPIDLFTDFYTSTIDTNNFASIALDARIMEANGILNIASSSISSKKEFAIQLAVELGYNLNWFKESSVKNLDIVRANSLGLDCSKAEKLYRRTLPTLKEVCKSLSKSLNTINFD